jgi:hypothetical protein
MKTAEQKLAEAMAEIERLKEAARSEAIKTAKFPWENPEIVQATEKMGYNFRMDPELYLKVKWVMENKGGIKSMQVLFDRAIRKYVDGIITELTGE